MGGPCPSRSNGPLVLVLRRGSRMGGGEPAIEAYDLGPAGLGVVGYCSFLGAWLLVGSGAAGVADGVGCDGFGRVGRSLVGGVGSWLSGARPSWFWKAGEAARGVASIGIGVGGLVAAAGGCVSLGGAAARRALRVLSGGVGVPSKMLPVSGRQTAAVVHPNGVLVVL